MVLGRYLSFDAVKTKIFCNELALGPGDIRRHLPPENLASTRFQERCPKNRGSSAFPMILESGLLIRHGIIRVL